MSITLNPLPFNPTPLTLPITPFQFKLVRKEERDLVHTWLAKPHVAEWFYGDGLQGTIKHLDEFLDGSLKAQYWIGSTNGRPFVFFITSNVEKPDDELSKWCSDEGKAITLDMLIGEESFLGKGLSAPVIQEFIRSQFPHVDEVLIDPEAANERAVHVYQKAGFEIQGEFVPAYNPKPHLMMKMKLSSNKI